MVALCIEDEIEEDCSVQFQYISSFCEASVLEVKHSFAQVFWLYKCSFSCEFVKQTRGNSKRRIIKATSNKKNRWRK